MTSEPRTYDRPDAPRILLSWTTNAEGTVVVLQHWREYFTCGGAHFGEKLVERDGAEELLALLTDEEIELFEPLIIAAREMERAITMSGLWHHKEAGCPMDQRCDLHRPLVILRDAIDHIIAKRS